MCEYMYIDVKGGYAISNNPRARTSPALYTKMPIITPHHGQRNGYHHDPKVPPQKKTPV